MSTENRKKVLLGFGAFAVVLIAVLAIWRPPAFRSEDASGSIGEVQKHHAPQITQKDVILGSETTRQEQQLRYGNLLDDAAKLRSLSAMITANNFAAASRDLEAMKGAVANRYQADANAAVAAARALARSSDNRRMDADVEGLSAVLQSGHLSAAEMESFNGRLAAFASQAGVKAAAEQAAAVKSEVNAAIAEMRVGQANAAAKMDSAFSELKAMNAVTLLDRLDALKAAEAESRGLARDSDVLGKMASRPLENQAVARAFDGTASELEMSAAKSMERQLGLIIVVCSAVRDIDANISAARNAAQASVAGRSQTYDRALANASQAFAGTQATVNAQVNAGVHTELYALNNYLDNSAAQAGARTPELKSFMGVLAAQLNSNTPLAASLADHDALAGRMQNMVNQKAGQKAEARN